MANGLGFNSYASRYMAGVVNAGGTTPGVNIQQYIEELAVRLFVAQSGIPTAAYPFYGGNAESHALDLFRHYDITWEGTVTHNSNGVTGDGSTGIGYTGINPTLALNVTSFSFSVYSRTNTSSDTDYEAGILVSAIGVFIRCRTVAGTVATRAGGQSAANFGGAVGASTGLFLVHRTATNSAAGTRNGTVFGSTAVAVGSLPNGSSLTVCGAAGLNFSNRNLAFAHVGPGLGSHSDFYTIVQDFQTALGRQV
jgi:hypothetical protein